MQDDHMEVLKDSEGQALLLSALVACACLIMLATYLYSITTAEAAGYQGFQRSTLDNVLWAQDLGLSQVAAVTGSCHWEQREELAATFKSRAGKPIDSASKSILAHGIACSFAFNETLAGKYLDENALTDVESIGGVLVKQKGGNANVCGYAFDLMLSDGTSQYSVSRVKIWD